MAGMRLATAVAMVAEKAEAYIAHHARESERGRDMLLLLSRITGEPLPSTPAAATATPKGKRPAPGSLGGRVLDILGEIDADAVSLKDIMARKPGANENAVRYQLQQLSRAGWVIATGATSTRRYSLPTKKGGR